jgi:GT2 family glycosyltransferase
MRTDLRDTVGMLDELFHPVQYEDLDLCLRARDQGWDVRYTPSVEIYHFEGITTASFGQKEYRRNIVRNSSRFRQRWQHCFPQLPPDPQIPGLEFRWLERDELGLEQELDLSQTPPEKEQA